MIYHSTRNAAEAVDSTQAILNGLANDGGLYVPSCIPAIDVEAVLSGSTMEMATALIGAMLPDLPNMANLVSRAYTGKFQTEELTPTVDTGKFTVLELFRGPTSAFKDVALCMLPQLLTAAKNEKGMQEDILILTATSGDTGKAALAGFQDVEGVKICVFYPDGGVSKVQRAQMVTQEGNNVIEAGPNAVEAPFVFKHGDYYYLFVSFDYCCRGANSTYKTVYGRSKKITGPFIDKDGKRMDKGGGTYLYGPNEEYFGVGHNAAFTYYGQPFFISHAYEKSQGSRAKLFIRPMNFDKDGWIVTE